ncbi:MAG: hypothetical protein AAAB35_20840 [Phyllobacterium sp.]|uniref:hypothetical protein n=1 Tax=Phyllobacterium sp. TaxID=1871046 RepID=UPI0030F2598C
MAFYIPVDWKGRFLTPGVPVHTTPEPELDPQGKLPIEDCGLASEESERQTYDSGATNKIR